MAKDGLFSRAKGLIGSSLDKSTITVEESLGSVAKGAKAIRLGIDETIIDLEGDVLDARVAYYERYAGSVARLVNLGYSKEKAEQLLNQN